MHKIRFMDWDCNLQFKNYTDGDAIAIQLIDANDGCPITMATTNIPEADLADGEILIKNYSENAGILAALVAGGIVEDTGRTFPAGHTVANICKLLVNHS